MTTNTALKVALGTSVDLELIDQWGDSERVTLEIVSDAAADFAQDRLGISTPLAKAILDQRAGTVLAYRQGDLQKVRILTVTWSAATVNNEAAQRRQAELEKARQAAEQTNAQMFASSFSGKWGNYDPKGVDEWDKK